MKSKNSFLIYGLLVHGTKRIITETWQKDKFKLLAILRWKKHHKHQRFLICLRGK